MKKLICLIGLIFLSQNTWSMYVDGQINWGPYINCEVYNDMPFPVKITDYSYSIFYTNGGSELKAISCQFGCRMEPFTFKRLTGPANSPYIMDATCDAHVRPIRSRRHRRN